jgi:competence protein ComEA
MLISLLVKLGMLAATEAVVVWIGWPVPQEQTAPQEQTSMEPAPLVASAPAQTAQAGQPAENKKLDLNRATAEELETLPGVGPVLAQRMVEWRKAHGRYRTVEDMRDVKGIGRKRMEQLRPLVTVKA